jgi:hypothetical protein
MRLERVVHWERIASRWRPAFSSHLIGPDRVLDASLVPETCSKRYIDSREIIRVAPLDTAM